jgi:outer membrane protein
MSFSNASVLMVALCAGPALLFAQPPEHPLTLEEAVAIGVQQSAQLENSAAAMEGARAKAGEAAAARLPALKLEAGYRRLSAVPPFEVHLPGTTAPVVISPNIPDTYTLRAGIQQPLFTGFRLQSNARAAELVAAAATAEYRNTRSLVVLGVTSAYWTLYQTRQVQKFVNENVARLENYVRDTRNLVQGGLATRNDLLRVEVQHATARLAAIDADNDVQVAAMQLNTLLGFPLDATISLGSLLPEPAGGAGETTGVRIRRDLEAMDLRVAAAREYLTAAHAGWWPQIALSANYYDNRPNQRFVPATDAFKTSWDIGVGLQWDIWNWLTPAYQSDQAAAQLRQSESQYRQMKDNIAIEAERARQAVSHSAEKISVAREMIAQAEENVRSLNDKYNAGLATSTELLDAEVTLLQANTGLSGAQVEYAVALARLEHVLGSPAESGSGDE